MHPSDRYDTSSLPEAQFEPGSRGRVLRNKLGIKSKKEMDDAESVALKIAIDKLLGMYDDKHRFTADDIRIMHKIWLADIYEWAGEDRQVNLSKSGFHFAVSLRIPLLMKEFEKGSLRRHTPCRFREGDRIIKALAEVHVELILIHPFREGNGRLARLLSILMAAQNNLPLIDFEWINGRRRSKYFAAVRAGLERNYKPMEDIFVYIMRSNRHPSRVAKWWLAMKNAGKSNPP